MAQNITIAGTTYPDVPSISVPKSGGGSASFVDTSDATATADKILSPYTAYGADGNKLIGTASDGSSVSDVIETLPNGGDHHIITSVPGSSGYDINSGDMVALFEQYVEENNMVKHDLSFAADQTDYVTINHTLGSVPVEALLYPKNPKLDGNGYQIGWTKNLFGQDKNGNRTYKIFLHYSPADATDVSYMTGKTLPALLTSVQITDYNFSRNPTSTTVDIRGGTNANTKLLAGDYVLALK